MAQVTIDIEPELEEKIQAAAKAANLSSSNWMASVIREKLQNEWPPSVVALAGAWTDLPEVDEIRATMGSDVVDWY